jgi:hypothetical protein
MKFTPTHFALGAVICGVIAIMIMNDYERITYAAGAAGFAISVGLFGIAAAIAGRDEPK